MVGAEQGALDDSQVGVGIPGVPCNEPGMSGSELCQGSRPICQLESCLLSAAAAAKSVQSCLTLCDPMDSSSPGSSLHGNSPGKNTGVGCHFFLQLPI